MLKYFPSQKSKRESLIARSATGTLLIRIFGVGAAKGLAFSILPFDISVPISGFRSPLYREWKYGLGNPKQPNKPSRNWLGRKNGRCRTEGYKLDLLDTLPDSHICQTLSLMLPSPFSTSLGRERTLLGSTSAKNRVKQVP